eukprot:2393166-Amphidinium_carterae.1
MEGYAWLHLPLSVASHKDCLQFTTSHNILTLHSRQSSKIAVVDSRFELSFPVLSSRIFVVSSSLNFLDNP